MHNVKTLVSYAAALLMLLLFALAIVASVLFGARIFRGMQADMENAYHERTASAYIAAKLRAADTQDAVCNTNLDGVDALVISETVDGASYVTYIYAFDGYLTELYCPASAQLTADAGERVIPLDDVTFSVSDGMVQYSCKIDGRSTEMQIVLRAS